MGWACSWFWWEIYFKMFIGSPESKIYINGKILLKFIEKKLWYADVDCKQLAYEQGNKPSGTWKTEHFSTK
jgi:hypothetical protein